MIDELDGLRAFIAVAEARSFRAAGEQLGVTRSAVSQSLQRLEDRLGAALLRRTTRSVSLTEAGESFYAAVRPALTDVTAALQAVSEGRGRPQGTLRLCISSIAESFLSGPVLASFLVAYPDLRLDLVVTDAESDIVAEGFDAGVRLGEVIERDMIAVPVSSEQRQLVVAAPDYIARHGAPSHPRELTLHHCIGWRPSPKVAPYRWEFTEARRDFDVAVDPRVTANDMAVMVRLACTGAGITCGLEETFRPYLDRGDLVPVLEGFCPPFPGFFLYYPSRRQMAPKLRALIDHVKRHLRGEAS